MSEKLTERRQKAIYGALNDLREAKLWVEQAQERLKAVRVYPEHEKSCELAIETISDVAFSMLKTSEKLLK